MGEARKLRNKQRKQQMREQQEKQRQTEADRRKKESQRNRNKDDAEEEKVKEEEIVAEKLEHVREKTSPLTNLSCGNSRRRNHWKMPCDFFNHWKISAAILFKRII